MLVNIHGLGSFNSDEYILKRTPPIIVIDQEEFKTMKEQLDANINREAAGLDDITIKKMLLTYYRGIYVKDAEIYIQLSDEEKDVDPFPYDTEETKLGDKKEKKPYLKTKGIVSIENEEGVELDYWPEDLLKQMYENEYQPNVNKKYGDDVKEYLSNCYTGGQNGEIQVYAFTTQDIEENYEYSNDKITGSSKSSKGTGKFETVNYSTNITQYSTPVEFLVNLMEITGSREYINAVMELVEKDSIVLTLCNIEQKTVRKETINCNQNMKVNGKKEIKLNCKFFTIEGNSKKEVQDLTTVYNSVDLDNGQKQMTVTIKNKDNNRESKVVEVDAGEFKPTSNEQVYLNENNNYTGKFVFIYNAYKNITKEDTGKWKKTRTQTDVEAKYDICVKSVTTWAIDKHLSNDFSVQKEEEKFSLDEKNVENRINSEDDVIIVKQNDNEEEIYKEKEKPEYFEMDYKKSTENGILGFQNSIYNYAIRKKEKNYDYKDYDFTEIKAKRTEIEKSTLITKTTSYLPNEIYVTTDNTDDFLALLSNGTGEYKRGEKQSFVSKNAGGKVVKYLDLYKGKARVGELLINGAEMLFELLDSSQNSQGLSDVMRYILWRYSNIDYGITNVDFSIFDTQGINSDGGTVLGSTAEEMVWYSLRNKEYSEYAVAGVMGNIYAESGFDPRKIEGGSGIGFGICQWSSSRRANLEKYATAKGTAANDIYTQVEYLMAELSKGGGSYASYQLKPTTYSGKTYTPDMWINANNIEDATKAFCYTFERPELGKEHMDVRIEKAKEYYNKYKGKTIDDILETNDIQKRIAQIAGNSGNYGISANGGKCLAWVDDVYAAADAPVERVCCAFCAGNSFSVSNDFSKIPVGAAVYCDSSTPLGKKYGHVGIYIGNGIVVDNTKEKRPLTKFLKGTKTSCWGWASKQPVNAAYKINPGLINKGHH